MRTLSEKTYHRFFTWGVVIKALISLGEIALGLLFYFFSQEAVRATILTIIGTEMHEVPPDFFSNLLLRGFQDFTVTSQSVWAFILLSHGIVKTFFIGGLLRNKEWAYPTSAVVFTLFVFYQLYQLSYAPSVFLWLITIFDIVLVGLIVHEYVHRRRRRALASA